MTTSVFPQIVRGKPLLAITNEELETAIADAEEAYVFLSGMDRDLAVSDMLQHVRKERKIYRVNITRSRLVVQADVWEFFGPKRRPGWNDGRRWKGYGYVCVLPNNEVIRTAGDSYIRHGPEVRFTTPATGYYIEVEGDGGYSMTNEFVRWNSFHDDHQLNCSIRDVPFGPFEDLE